MRHYFGINPADEPRTVRAKVTGHFLTLDEALKQAISPVLELLDAGTDDSAFRLLDPRQRREETLEALRRVFVRESRPLLLVSEDLHWIDAETQALLNTLVDGLSASPMLLLTTYRPEYQHDWGDKSHYSQLRIDPLSAASSEELLQALLGDGEELDALKKLLVARTEGNPFFLEETVRTLAETGALAGARGAHRMRGSADALQAPATVHAVLAARIDRLAADDKELLQAPVIGHDVPLALLERVAACPGEALRAALARLQAAEFLYESSLFPDIQYAFKHALTHEAAYGGLLRDHATALHACALGALEDLLGERRLEHAEVLARHALRAEICDPAVAYLHEAARRAYGRTALSDAIARYEQALALVPRLLQVDETLRRAIDLRLDLHYPLLITGHTRRLSEVDREAEVLARQLGDPRRLGHVAHRLGYLALFGGGRRDAARYASEALRIATAIEDRELAILARYLLGTTQMIRGAFHEAVESFWLIVDGPDADLARRVIVMTGPAYPGPAGWLAWALSFAGDFEQARLWSERGVAAAGALGHLPAQALTWLWRGGVLAEQGEFAEALPWLYRSATFCTEQGLVLYLVLIASGGYGWVLASLGRAAEALACLERAATISEELGIRVRLARNQALLAESLLLVRRLEDSRRTAARALELARAEDERGTQDLALHLLGEAARLADSPDAENALARQAEAVAITRELGFRPLEARCELAIGRTLRRAGDVPCAREHFATAASMFREMSMRHWLEQAEHELAEGSG